MAELACAKRPSVHHSGMEFRAFFEETQSELVFHGSTIIKSALKRLHVAAWEQAAAFIWPCCEAPPGEGVTNQRQSNANEVRNGDVLGHVP